jgi:hypothetical protein
VARSGFLPTTRGGQGRGIGNDREGRLMRRCVGFERFGAGQNL